MKNDSNDILREMNKINWADIPPGIDSTSVTRDFAKFAADNPDEREQAYACFDNRIVIQGTLYESAFYITPFLIELLRRRTAANLPCEAIYDLLYQIAEGSFHGCGPMVECDIVTKPFVYYIPKKGGTLLPLSNACRDAVLAGWEVYRADLMNPRALESNNAFALDLVSLFRDHILLKRTVLQQTAEARAHSTIGQTARKQLQEIDSPDSAQVEHLMNVTRLINLLDYEDRYITAIEPSRENLSLTLHINLLSRTACGISKNPYKLESIWERLHEKDIPNGIIRFEGVTEIKKSSHDFELNDEIYCITITGLLGGAAAYEWKIDGACVTDSGSIVNGYYLVQANDICLIDPRAPETRIIW